jgi:hypothetical protein
MAAGRRFSPQVAQPFRVPNMDYSAQTPGIIRRNTPPVDAAALRNADYKTPPPARHGFTRSPKEADVLVCAQCDQELGVETDTPQAGQVWAGKCGHVGFFRGYHLDIILIPSSATAVSVRLAFGRPPIRPQEPPSDPATAENSVSSQAAIPT